VLFKELIKKKRDGKELTEEEIRFAVYSYLEGAVPDYQMASLLMAIFLRGLTDRETLALTKSMLESGERVVITTDATLVDKHSTGGIGDKVSLLLAPLLAELGLGVPMLSGRALGFTGGTVDKLESTGMKVELSPAEIEDTVKTFGFSISSQTAQVAPADRKIYALRDATSTVESIPLIVSSILSKKLAVNTTAIVFDVKCGSGAFMKEEDSAVKLARKLVDISRMYRRRAGALVTEMGQPLGRFAGNALEVLEAVTALSGKAEDDLLEVTASLAGALLELCGKTSFRHGRALARETLLSGKAVERFVRWIEYHGGSPEPKVAPNTVSVPAETSGYISAIDGESLGFLLVELGGGRRKAEDAIDHSVGLEFFKKVGDFVEEGEPIGRIYFSDGNPKELSEKFLSAYRITERAVPKPTLIKRRIL
jgi:pyrimidine-nucleoside phosphorylase